MRINLEATGQRLDVALTEALQALGKDVSRSEITKAFQDKRIKLGEQTPKSGLKLDRPYVVEVELLPKDIDMVATAEAISLDIVYEDEYLLVINKPRGLVVHPAPGHRQGTLVNALLNYCGQSLSNINGDFRPGIVHRIDKDTSGLLVVAKNNKTHRRLAMDLAKHKIKRVYQAIVFGNFSEQSGVISAPIGRDPKNRQRMTVIGTGKEAVSKFTVETSMRGFTKVRVELETGRTHQIRVHMKYIGHPVVGDPLYANGRKNFNLDGQLLHAGELHFKHPHLDKMVDCYAPAPEIFQEFIDANI